MIKFLAESTDTPHTEGVESAHMPLPEPGVDEYRRYWNEHEVTQTSYSSTESGEMERETITVLTASYVSVQCDHEPTEEEWTACLQAEGYTDDKIKEIFGNA